MSKKVHDQQRIISAAETESLIGRKRSFSVTEAHKRLRTNVMFSFSGESECRVIGVTSTMTHEGKSTTAMNLAYDLQQAGKKVLLIDADMRMSHIAETLNIHRAPGLSNILVGESNGDNVMQRSAMLGSVPIISCGDYPPNPTELLSSKRMSMMLDALKNVYKFIIIDLPPVSEVADALIVTKLIDGMLLVVRQDYADRNLLDDTVRQLKQNEANIIGFVLTCAKQESRGYKYKNGYGHYGYYSKNHE